MQGNYFKWFDLPETYDLDLNVLKEKYYLLSKNTHPDNFYNKSQLEIQMAQQALGQTHKGYEILSCPIKRASYILFLHKLDINSEAIERQVMSPDFLTLVFEWQMQENKEDLKSELTQNIQLRLDKIMALFIQHKFEQAVMPVREIMFIKKILEQA